MNSLEEKKLEDFIHTRLHKLPRREAPDNLINNVLAAIAIQKEVPWYKQSWTEWPRTSQTFFLLLLFGLAGLLVQVLAPVSDSLSAPALAGRVQSVAWVWDIVASLFGAFLLVVNALSWQWFTAFALTGSVMYLACIATGMALYRVTDLDNRSAL